MPSATSTGSPAVPTSPGTPPVARTPVRSEPLALPGWLGHPVAGADGADPVPAQRPSRVGRAGAGARLALRRTVASTSALLATSVRRSGTGPRGGTGEPSPGGLVPRPLERVDTRLVLVLTLAALVGTSLARSPVTLLAACLVFLGAARWYGTRLDPFLRRVWLTAPLLTTVLVAPATLNVVAPGPVVVPLAGSVGLTSTGLVGAALVVLRVLCSLTVVLAVTATVEWSRILNALTALHVPRVFTAVVAMAYRYALVLATVVADAVEARQARTVRPLGRGGHGAGHLGGAVLGRASTLSEEVHGAMVARGFTGGFHGPTNLGDGSRRAGVAAVAVVALALAAGVALDRVSTGWLP